MTIKKKNPHNKANHLPWSSTMDSECPVLLPWPQHKDALM